MVGDRVTVSVCSCISDVIDICLRDCFGFVKDTAPFNAEMRGPWTAECC